MKKAAAIIICAIMTFSLLCACAAEQDEKPLALPSAPEEQEEEELNFNGKTFTLADGLSGEATYVFLPTLGDAVHSDNWLDLKKKTENNYNCKIEVFEGTVDGCISAAAVGTHYADLINNRLKQIFNLWENDMCYDIGELDIDFESGKYGSPQLLESLTWKDITVAVYGNFWGMPCPNMSNTMMYNPRIIREYGMFDPQELYEKNQWSWYTFEDMAKLIAEDNSEEPANKKYIATNTSYIVRMAIYSYGTDYYRVDENGKYINNLSSAETLSALGWIQDMFAKGYLYKNTDLQTVLERFYTGLDVFLPEYSMQGIAKEGGDVGLNMEEEYRWIYYPKGNADADVTSGKISAENFFLTVPYDVEPATLSPFMDVFFEKSFAENYDWQTSFIDMNIYDAFSGDYYFEMWNSAKFDFSVFFNIDTVNSVLIRAVQGTKALSEAIADSDARVGRLLDKYLNTDLTDEEAPAAE